MRLPIPIRVIVVGFLVFFGISEITWAQGDPLARLCQVFQNNEKFNGKMVTVRGELNSSRHGSALVNEHCSKKVKIGPYESGN